MPHGTEEGLSPPFDSARIAFVGKYSDINKNIPYSHMSVVDSLEACVRRIGVRQAELEQCDTNSPSNSNTVNILNNFRNDTTVATSIPTSQKGSNFSDVHDNFVLTELQTCIMSRDAFCASCEKLTSSQSAALDIPVVHNHFKSKTRDPLYLFITGGARVGKSYLIRLVVAYLQLFTATVETLTPVRLCATTGTAARNVQGSTIHILLKIPVSHYREYNSLGPFHLSKLRTEFAGVHTLTIDEINMVSDVMLTFSRRLQEITHSSLPLGSLNIISAADFFQVRPIKSRDMLFKIACCGRYSSLFS